jgi:hypothetical protein
LCCAAREDSRRGVASPQEDKLRRQLEQLEHTLRDREADLNAVARKVLAVKPRVFSVACAAGVARAGAAGLTSRLSRPRASTHVCSHESSRRRTLVLSRSRQQASADVQTRCTSCRCAALCPPRVAFAVVSPVPGRRRRRHRSDCTTRTRSCASSWTLRCRR